ncbi:unnamed protein product [Rotaria magnacalcarata]|uniref:UBX domain-containing protein n=1 Tax=Rotaria magnacalcarata TaxID=392030 RepID=A0A8S2P5P4_9BILA|nr:unnamed protein product [Rotaria magnacalcarata]
MSDQSREQILSDFQNCTGLEHIDECIHVLEQYEWNLPAAVQSVLDRIGCANDKETTVPNQDTVNNSTSSVAINTTNQNVNNKRQSDSNDIDDLDQPRTIKTIPGSQRTTTGIIGPVVRDLNFTIECRDRTEQIAMFDNESVYQLKAKICEKIPIPPNKQNFVNWETKSFDDQTILRDLHLPKENKIQLSSIENGSASRTQTHKSSEEFPVTVLCEDQSGKMVPFKLILQSNTTISDLKKKIEHSAHIPLQSQSWQGLLGANDSDELRQTSITSQIPLIVHHSDRQLPSMRKEIKAIPDECTDDVSALENFARVFHARYGSTGPILYIGPLDQAIQDSVYASIHNRRPLAIYLHNDQSVCANVFCSQVLATDSIVEYLANNYVFWAWDVTSASNRTRLFETVRRCVGNQCVHRVGSIENDTFPLILIVIRSRGLLELVNIIEGKSTPSEVLLNLIQSHESFEEQRLRDVDEEIMREKRENLKKQQEDEYEQSLQADLAKERARQEEYDANERLKQQRLQQQEESKARLPEEPSETEKNITRLKIRLPNDEGVLMRRFHINNNLQVLFDYLTTHGRMLGEYKLLTTYPKRDLASLNASDTFEQLKLYPQEQLILESL